MIRICWSSYRYVSHSNCKSLPPGSTFIFESFSSQPEFLTTVSTYKNVYLHRVGRYHTSFLIILFACKCDNDPSKKN